MLTTLSEGIREHVSLSDLGFLAPAQSGMIREHVSFIEFGFLTPAQSDMIRESYRL